MSPASEAQVMPWRQLPREFWQRVIIQPVRQKRAWLVTIIASLAFLALSQALFLFLVGPLIGVLFSDASASAQVTLQQLLPGQLRGWLGPYASLSWDRATLNWALPLSLVALALLKGHFTYLNQFSLQRLSLWVAASLRETIFRSILGSSWRSLVQHSPAEWMSLVMNDVQFLQARFSDIVTTLVRDVVVSVACIGALLIIHPPTAILLLAIAPLIAVVLGRIGRRISQYAQAWQRMLAKLAEFALSLRKRFDFIRSQGGEAFELARFETMNRRYYDLLRQSIIVRSAFAPVLEWFGFAIFAGCLWLVGKGFFGEALQGERLIQFLAGIGLVIRPLRNIGEQYSRLGETMGALQRAIQVVLNASTELPIVAKSALPKTGPMSTAIAIADLQVSYGAEIIAQITNVNIQPGKAIAIVGPSGGGKSSLARVFAGLLHPVVWQADQDWASFARCIGFVSQKPFLFRDSVRANLLYGKDAAAAKLDDAIIWDMLRLVRMDTTVRQLPHGLDQEMGATQSQLSGGQTQRLTIARMLLDQKPVWILDEATSAIDPENERLLIQDLLSRARETATSVLFVTHRLDVLPLFQEAWFIEGGKLQFVGTPAMLEKWPRFREFKVHLHDA